MKSVSLEYINSNKDQFKVCKSGVINYRKNDICIDELCDCNNEFDEAKTIDQWLDEQYDFLTDGNPTEENKKIFSKKLYTIAE